VAILTASSLTPSSGDNAGVLKRPESVLVVIYSQALNVLVLQRDDDAEFWQSVTGTIEEGETAIQTAYREVAEETGLQLNPRNQNIVDCRHLNQYKIRRKWLYRYPEGTTYNNEYVFCARVQGELPIILSEHTQYEWLNKRAAMQKVWSETNRSAIAQFVPEG